MSTIKFTADENPSRFGSKSGPCIGRITHNRKLGPKEIAALIANECGTSQIMAEMFVNSLNYVIPRAIANGNSLDFGAFRIGIAMSGTLPAANAPFSEENDLELYFKPSAALSEALKELEPVNATPVDKPFLFEICTDGELQLKIIVLGKRVIINGNALRVDTTKEDEGVWLENDLGEKLCKAEVSEAFPSRIACKFNGELAAGNYVLAVQTRNGDPSAMIARATKRVKVKA